MSNPQGERKVSVWRPEAGVRGIYAIDTSGHRSVLAPPDARVDDLVKEHSSAVHHLPPYESEEDGTIHTRTTVERVPPMGVPEFIDREEDSAEPIGSKRFGPGDHIGRYRIRSVLARGGMGVVLGAADRQLGRRVAIKVVRPPASDELAVPARRERLLREAQALAQVSHPNIVGIYDVGTADDALFIAMEYVEGTDLRGWLQTHEPGWRQVMDVFLQAGEGLAAAHAAGIVHRDFKPANVLVGNDGRVRVADFGLARAMELELELDPEPAANDEISSVTRPAMLSARLTDVNIVLGTAGYIAPEQLLRQHVGPHTDQFSFCVALYEALFGVKPYAGADVIDMVQRFKRGQIEPPRRRPPGLPRRVRRALLRGLQMDPALRHPSMGSLLRELRDERPTVAARLGGAALVAGTALLAAYAAVWAHDAITSGPPVPAGAECEDPGHAAESR